MGLGVALVVAVLVIHGVIDKSFHRGSQGYDLIVGAKGSPLQLVLNTVFHLSESIETIPYSYYEELNEGRFASSIETAVPVCMGHDYRGFCVVATNPDMFDKLKYLDDRPYTFAEGAEFPDGKTVRGRHRFDRRPKTQNEGGGTRSSRATRARSRRTTNTTNTRRLRSSGYWITRARRTIGRSS